MKNFSFSNPVKIIFGKGTIKNISEEIPKGNKVLILYGGGSIKKNGVYDQVKEALKDYSVVEFSGIEPNPHYETCMKAVELIKKEKVDFLLSVGGGSVLDATKFIAAATLFEGGDPWKILSEGASINGALPLGCVITLPATGSEMNCGGVITRVSSEEKLPFNLFPTYPKFSVLDPETTYTLPTRQIGNGVVDAFVHVIEQYLTTGEDSSPLQDYMSEAILKTLLEEGPKALKNPLDYDVRANLMWASTWGLNGWINCGVDEDWATHLIGHEITAFYGLDHAQTLAVILPGVIQVMKEQKKKKIIRLAKEVFKLTASNDDELVQKTISAIENFFEGLGVKTKLSDYNLNEDAIAKVSARIAERGWKLGERANITSETVKEILGLRL